ncbi:MAG TPA: tRNA epoxyqueuosine(34) reductase QueG, partial [Burkholderiaceae bacterium]|nr:tRNA epoxyqueuosine(34) reductase QueG [Burkholderiaceae bacterium]
CQLVCPWNKYAKVSTLPDFDPREPLTHTSLLQLWAWSEADFLRHTEGGPIRRIGYERWRRNLAVGLGNALRKRPDAVMVQALQAARESASELVREHIDWALTQA